MARTWVSAHDFLTILGESDAAEWARLAGDAPIQAGWPPLWRGTRLRVRAASPVDNASPRT